MITTSKYEENGFDLILSGLIKVYNPRDIVELGTQQGASAIILAQALSDEGHVFTHDLFLSNYDKPPYSDTHADLYAALDNISAAGLSNKITVIECEASLVADEWDEVDILHIDLCNHYDNVRPLLHQWYKKVNQLILLEGGGFNKWQKANAFIPFSHALYDLCVQDYYHSIILKKNEDYALTILIRK